MYFRFSIRNLFLFGLSLCLLLSCACECGNSGDSAEADEGDLALDDVSDDSAADDALDDDTAATDDTGDDSSDDDADDDDGDDDAVTGVGWVVGYIDNGEDWDAVMWRDDHGVWSEETLPDVGTTLTLFGVEALSAGNVWAVGWKGDRQNPVAVLLHRNISGWTEVDLSGLNLHATGFVWVEFLNPDYGWIYGWAEDNYMILRYRNGVWDAFNAGLLYESMTVNSITLAAEDDAWFVGNAAWFWISSAYHFHSGTWSSVPALSTTVWGSNIDIAMETPEHGYVTTCTADIPVIISTVREYRDGTWRLLDEPILPDGCFHQVALTPGGIAHIAGRQEVPVMQAVMISEVANGWDKDAVADLGGASPTFYEMDFPEENVGYAVGEQILGSQTRGLVLRYEDGAWTVEDPPSRITNAIYTDVSYL